MFDSIVRLNAALEGRYRVLRVLGEGGMAIVYLADDLRHGRRVALKVLKPDLAAALGTDRFHAEIRTTANLQHPHLLPLFDSGRGDGLLFYTMPYLEGQTSQRRLEREHRLPVEEAVRVASNIASALQAAHEQGVVHRDIKPSNLLLSGDHILVGDFGIAQAAAFSGPVSLTQTGSSIGTVGYMSPEQATGAAAVDHRSDIYSLGCVLFEMLAGDPPFKGQSVVEVLTKQLTGLVPSIRAIRPDTPPEVERAVSAALAKDPSQRFDSMAAFAAALASRGDRKAAPARAGPTIVVLPFVNRSSDPDDDYFGDGLTDEVISDLSIISALRVISRNSAMALKGTTKDTPTLARELGVTHLVMGSVRRAGTALRVTADLVEASTDTPIWSQKFSGTLDDVFGIQEQISMQIVSALKVRLTDTESREVADRRIDNPVAFDCYLRARQVMYHWTPDAQHQALRLVDQAMDIVGETPLLLATKGQIHWNVVQTGLGPREGLEKAAELTAKALALEPDYDLAIYVRGLVAGTRGQTEATLADLYRTRQLRPGDGNVLVEFCRYSLSAGLDKRAEHLARLMQIDPLTPQTHLLHGMSAYYDGRPADGASSARRAIQLAPDPSMLHGVAGLLIASAGFHDEASGILDRVVTSRAADPHRHFAAFMKHALKGDERRALQVPIRELETVVSNEHLLRMIADGYGLLGKYEDALRVLHAAVCHGFINHPNLSTRSAALGSLRDTAGFQDILAGVKQRWDSVIDWEKGLAP